MNTFNNEELLSKTIRILRFPLIVGVVLIHTRITNFIIGGQNMTDSTNHPVYDYVRYLFGDTICCISVPLFFFISGFLFFHKITDFNGNTYLRKMKKRARSLLVPYIFWNLIVILMLFLTEKIMPGLRSGLSKNITDFNCTDWLYAFWNNNPAAISVGFPIDIPLWFIRNLMIVVLFSPLIWWLLKRIPLYAISLFGIGWLWGNNGYWLWECLCTTAFFFTAGAWFSVYRKNFVETFNHLFPYSLIIYLVTVFILLCTYKNECEWQNSLHNLSILTGIPTVVALASRFVRSAQRQTGAFLASASFFIYAYHYYPLKFVQKILVKLLSPHSEALLILLFFLSAAITILIGLGIYALLKRYLPRTTALITGGR